MSPSRLAIILPLVLLTACATSQEKPPGSRDETEQVLPPRWTKAYAEKVGRPLLIAQDWERAAEVYGGSYAMSAPFVGDNVEWISLWGEVSSVWDSHRNKPQAEQDRFHFHLVNFFFLHGSLMRHALERMEGSSEFPEMEKLAREYPAWAEALPDDESADRLDFSHVDLLHDLPGSAEEAARGVERVYRALEANPDSIPAILAFLWHAEHAEDHSETYARGSKLLTGRIGRLTLARRAIEAFDEMDPSCTESLEDAMEIATSREEKALFLGFLAQAIPEWKRESSVRRIFETYPDTWVGEAAGTEVVELAVQGKDPERALAEIRRLQEDGFGGGEELEAGLVRIGNRFLEKGDLERAETVLREVAGGYTEWSRLVSDAMFRLSEVHEERGDEEERLRWLERAIGGDPCNPDAAACLARMYEAKGLWADAARAWERYIPEGSFCGNCSVGEMRDRLLRLARAKAAAGEGKAAVRMLAEYVAGPMALDLSPSRSVTTLYDLYGDAGQIGDLREILRAVEEKRSRTMARVEAGPIEDPPLPYLVTIYELGTRGEVQALIGILRDPKGFRSQSGREGVDETLVRREALEALVRCGKAAVEPLRRAAAEKGLGCLWMIEALGRNPAEESLEALARLAREDPPGQRWFEEEDWQWRGPADWLDALGEALARKGEGGKNLLDGLLEDREGLSWEYAWRWLARVEDGWTDSTGRPPVPPGSLPKEIVIP